MLDQVKSTTSARIATARPAGGSSVAGPGVASRRVDPASTDNGVDHEQGRGGAMPERQGSSDSAVLPEGAIDEALAKAKVLIAPEGDAARANADNALKRLLREARDASREPRSGSLPFADDAAAAAPETFQKASAAYSQQEVLVGRTDVLRPGAVFSARF